MFLGGLVDDGRADEIPRRVALVYLSAHNHALILFADVVKKGLDSLVLDTILNRPEHAAFFSAVADRQRPRELSNGISKLGVDLFVHVDSFNRHACLPRIGKCKTSHLERFADSEYHIPKSDSDWFGLAHLLGNGLDIGVLQMIAASFPPLETVSRKPNSLCTTTVLTARE